MSPKPISIQMYTVRELSKNDFAGVIRQIADIGYVGIESGPGPMKPGEFKKFVDDLGLKVSSTWMKFDADSINQAIEFSQMFGVKHFAGCFGPEFHKTREDTLKTAAHFQKLAELLKPHGLEYTYHNHWWEFVKHADGKYPWDVLMEAAPDLRCEFDMYWASNFGAVDVPAMIKKYAKRSPLYHVKDGPLIKDQPNTAVGKGKMDIPACVSSIDDATTKWLIVELDAYVRGAEHMMEAVRDSYTYLVGKGFATGRK